MQLYILPCCMAVLALTLGGLFFHNADLRKHPVMFAQARVVALKENIASFELFDGQIIHLTVKKAHVLHIGDYGRLTYRAGRFLGLE